MRKNPIAVACCGKTVVLWILKKQEIGQGREDAWCLLPERDKVRWNCSAGREDAWCLLPPWKDGVQGKVSGVCLSETAPGFVCVFHVRSLPVLFWKTVQMTVQAVRRASLAWVLPIHRVVGHGLAACPAGEDTRREGCFFATWSQILPERAICEASDRRPRR